MYNNLIRRELTDLARSYAKRKGFTLYPGVYSNDAVIWEKIDSNFNPKSWNNITKNQTHYKRTRKIHSHFPNAIPEIYEMQSSNSSDALGMNVFCFPEFTKWKGIKDLFSIVNPPFVEFGFKPGISKMNNGSIYQDSTEIDACINNEILCEFKLTEENFTEIKKSEVQKYVRFKSIFHTDELNQTATAYKNYQLIRNILAAEQYGSRFILLCDMRRPDLVKNFYQTIRCIKDEYLHLRVKCEIIFWQDIALTVGNELRDFLKEKYGI